MLKYDFITKGKIYKIKFEVWLLYKIKENKVIHPNKTDVLFIKFRKL